MKQKGFTFLVNPFFDYKLKLSKNRPIKLCSLKLVAFRFK